MRDLVFFPAIAALALMSGLEMWDSVKPAKVSMALVSLEYREGKFYQVHRVEGAEWLRAEWAARVTREDRFLCVGGGTSTYTDGGSPRMTPSEWTGTECPPLQAGDVAVATWQYTDEEGTVHTLSGQIRINEP